MIKANSPTWPGDIARLLKRTDYDPRAALALMGKKIEKQLVESIQNFTDPRNAPSTIRSKGFDKPLIGGARDSGGGGEMWKSVDSEVT
jgi:hypothetical protein